MSSICCKRLKLPFFSVVISGGSCNSVNVGEIFTSAFRFFAASQCLLNEAWPKDAHLRNGSSFDFIIVGAGTAGSTLAARLSENPQFSVLLVEAGTDPPQESIVPAFKDLMKSSRFDWNFTTVNDHYSSQSLDNGEQHQPRGKMLGGSGSMNDMVYARGFPNDYEEWADLVGEDWRWKNVLEYFKKTEDLTDERFINDPEFMQYHKTGGNIEVAGLNESTYTTDVIMKAFKESGFQTVKDMTYPKYGLSKYSGRFSHTISKGRRHSSLTALLNKANNRNNLFVLKEAHVAKVLIENKVAVGIKVLKGGHHLEFFARFEVIISAGTFNTPKLLLLSGIGPQDHLEELGINVVQDLPVGENLHDHAMVMTYIAAENGTCYYDDAFNYKNTLKYLHNRTGEFSRTNSFGAYISRFKPYETPDFGIYPVCLPQGLKFYKPCKKIMGFKNSICKKLDEMIQKYELFTIAVVLLKPKSRGKVKLRSTDPMAMPLIYSGTFSTVSDLEGFPDAMSSVWSIVNSTYFKNKNAFVVDFNLDGCEEAKTLSVRQRCIARNMVMSAWHSVGTAAMGRVVDARLRLYGVEGLRVVDASVMPKVIRGNTNSPVVMIAERAADFIKEDHASILIKKK